MSVASPDLEIQLERLRGAAQRIQGAAPGEIRNAANQWYDLRPSDIRPGDVNWVQFHQYKQGEPYILTITFSPQPADRLVDALLKSQNVRGARKIGLSPDSQPEVANLTVKPTPVVSFFVGRTLHFHCLPLADLPDPTSLVERLANSLSNPSQTVRSIG